ncbi:hypothetical protein ACFLY4_08775 [Chloroflexota bacterium]
MIPQFQLTRPHSLENGNTYLYQDRVVVGQHQEFSVVKFLDYDPCPAFVIVQKLDGSRLRCLREGLFTSNENDHQTFSMQLASFFNRQLNKVNPGNKSHH